MRGRVISVVNAIYLLCAIGKTQAEPSVPSTSNHVSVVVVAGRDQPIPTARLNSMLSEVAQREGLRVVDAFALAATTLQSGDSGREERAPFVRAQQIMKAAWLSYLEGRASFAAERLTEARNIAIAIAHLRGGPELIAEVSLRLGVTKLELNRLAEASDDFRLAHALAPGRTVDDSEFKPEIVESFATAVAIAGAPQILPIKLRPSGAELFVDGKSMVPGETELSDGLHLITAQASGFFSDTRLVSVSLGAGTAIEIDLAPNPQAADVMRGREGLSVGASGEQARQIVESVFAYSGIGTMFFISSVWRRQEPALLGQYCTGNPVQCSSVVEIGYSEGGSRAAMRDVFRRARAGKRRHPPTLQSDARILSGEQRPVKKGPVARPLWKNRWLWLGVATASAAGTALYLLGGDDSIRPIFSGNGCDFGICE